jgi:hypothetical protein
MKVFLIPVLSVAAVGCAAPANPPSLMPRAIESRSEVSPTPPPSIPPQPATVSLVAKIAALLAEAKAGERDFAKTSATGSAALKSGRAATPGSEAWIAAEQIQSALQVARQRSAAALAEIDTLAVTQAELETRDPSIGGFMQIQAAQAEVEAIVARQSATLENLSR